MPVPLGCHEPYSRAGIIRKQTPLGWPDLRQGWEQRKKWLHLTRCMRMEAFCPCRKEIYKTVSALGPGWGDKWIIRAKMASPTSTAINLQEWGWAGVAGLSWTITLAKIHTYCFIGRERPSTGLSVKCQLIGMTGSLPLLAQSSDPPEPTEEITSIAKSPACLSEQLTLIVSDGNIDKRAILPRKTTIG